MIYLNLSVDWEVDCGKWKSKDSHVDYGGVIVGTQIMCDILDRYKIPFTWFVETNKEYIERDIPKNFPEIVKNLSKRKLDEIGTHIHFGKYDQTSDTWIYPEPDEKFKNESLQYAQKELNDLGINPVSFRSGNYFKFNRLPLFLKENKYEIESSKYYDGWLIRKDLKSLRDVLNIKNRLYNIYFNKPLQPYECDIMYCKKKGASGITEHPVSMHLMYLLENDTLYNNFFSKITRIKKDIFLNLYFHIFEITDSKSGPNGDTKPDISMIKQMHLFISRLHSMENIQFVTLREANSRYLDKNSIGM